MINRIDHRINDNNMFLGRFDFTRTYTANSPGATALQTGLGIASTTTSAKSNLLLTPATNYTTLGAVDERSCRPRVSTSCACSSAAKCGRAPTRATGRR